MKRIFMAALLVNISILWARGWAADAPDLPAKRPESPRYSPAGKRDPFLPPALKTKARPRERDRLAPLERYEIGQLKLVGIVWDPKEPRAMVEDAAGLGYVLRIGTPIGTNGGKVKRIKPGEVVIEESYNDLFGALKIREISMKLAVE